MWCPHQAVQLLAQFCTPVDAYLAVVKPDIGAVVQSMAGRMAENDGLATGQRGAGKAGTNTEKIGPVCRASVGEHGIDAGPPLK